MSTCYHISVTSSVSWSRRNFLDRTDLSRVLQLNLSLHRRALTQYSAVNNPNQSYANKWNTLDTIQFNKRTVECFGREEKGAFTFFPSPYMFGHFTKQLKLSTVEIYIKIWAYSFLVTLIFAITIMTSYTTAVEAEAVSLVFLQVIRYENVIAMTNCKTTLNPF